MDNSLKNKVLQMDVQKLNHIIENPEIYAPEVVELAKSRVEELNKLAEMSKELQAKVEAMSIDELKQIIAEPEVYSKDVVQFAKHCLKDKKKDFSDVPQEAKDSLSKMTAEQLLDMLDEKEDMLSENIVLYIKDIISNKLNEPTGDKSSVNTDKEKTTSDTSIVKNATITVEEGHYRVWKKFFKVLHHLPEQDDKEAIREYLISSYMDYSDERAITDERGQLTLIADVSYKDLSYLRESKDVDFYEATSDDEIKKYFRGE